LGSVQQHIAACGRCQGILGLLKNSDAVELQAPAENASKLQTPEEIVMDPQASISATGALGVGYVSGLPRDAAAPSSTTQPQPARLPQDISRGRYSRTLRWTAPAGAIAAGLLIWLAAHENNRVERRALENVEVAQEQPAEQELRKERSAPLPAAPPSGTASDSAPVSPQRAYSTEEQHNPKRGAGATRESKMPAKRAENSVADEARADNLQVGAAASPVDGAGNPTVKPPSAAPANTATSSTDARTQEAPSANNGADLSAKQSAVPSDKREKTGEDSVATSSQQVEVESHHELLPSFRRSTGFGIPTIVAPSGMVLWRLHGNGVVERSIDGGITWTRQNTGGKFELLSGSAPGDNMCWVVGGGGTILRTVDGGGHWSKLASPVTGEISGIRAMDALHATLLDTNGQVSFKTSDGGLTWAQAKK